MCCRWIAQDPTFSAACARPEEEEGGGNVGSSMWMDGCGRDDVFAASIYGRGVKTVDELTVLLIRGRGRGRARHHRSLDQDPLGAKEAMVASLGQSLSHAITTLAVI
jgi:hypothetical protein